MWFKKSRIYADAAAATPLFPRAKAELVRLLDLYGNPGALHKEAVAAKNELEKARKIVADAIGAHPDEIIFTSGGTEANNLALHNAHGHVVTSAIEHSSVLAPLEKSGATVTRLYEFDDIKDAITPETTLISIQLVNSEVGTIQPIADIAKKIHGKNILLHADASQAPLWVDIQVEKLHVDMMTLDGQKIGGPKGVGCIYIKRGTKLDPLIYGGGQERGMRSGTENVPLVGAFAVALQDAQTNIKERVQKVGEVRDYLWQEIKKIAPDAVLHGPEPRVANNLNFSIPGLDGQMAVIALDAAGIAAGTRSACDTGDDAPSHVLLALGVEPNLARGAIRISLLPNATKTDTSCIVKEIANVVNLYRQK
ncbi:MAG: cysteine desulfurase family protein [Patescibacteria group bacterium]